jgi:hypothetical protein
LQALTVEPESGNDLESASDESVGRVKKELRLSKIVKLKVKVTASLAQSFASLDESDAPVSAASSESKSKGKTRVNPILEIFAAKGKSEENQLDAASILVPVIARTTGGMKRVSLLWAFRNAVLLTPF